jgi:uncharacterized phage-like protein YoqJ
MVTGHRPRKIGGYKTPNPTERWVRAHLHAVLARMKARHTDLVAISGMALGVDLIFVEEAIRLGIPFVAAVPFEGQDSRWPSPSQRRYRELLAQASQVIRVDEEEGYRADTLKGQFLLRNKWMIDHSDSTVAVWDGSRGGTGHAVKASWDQGRSVLCIDPAAQTVAVRHPQAA